MMESEAYISVVAEAEKYAESEHCPPDASEHLLNLISLIKSQEIECEASRVSKEIYTNLLVEKCRLAEELERFRHIPPCTFNASVTGMLIDNPSVCITEPAKPKKSTVWGKIKHSSVKSVMNNLQKLEAWKRDSSRSVSNIQKNPSQATTVGPSSTACKPKLP